MAAQNTCFLRADSLNGISGLGVSLISEQLYSIAPQLLERMTKHEVLRFGVDVGSLAGGREEGKTNFEPTVSGFNTAKARAACNLARLSVYCGERQLRSRVEGCFSSI